MRRLNIGSALAADGKRLRGANRNGDGFFKTATLVAHDTGLPVASHGFHDKSGERSAIAALFEEVSLAGRVITVDALHTVRDTARSIVKSHNADYLMTVKANAPETYETLSTINWNRDATGAFEEDFTKEHGRIERRRIQTMTPLRGTVNYPHIAQIFRIKREREMCKSGKKAPKSPTASLQFQRTGAHRKTCMHGTAVIGRSKTATIGRETSISERMPASAARCTSPSTVQSATASRSRSSSSEVPKSLKRDATSICIVTKR